MINTFRQFFRSIFFELRYIFEELILRLKHPTRPGEIYHHWCNLWDHIIFHPWYCLKRGIRNIWVYFPIIWRTDVYDYCYLTELIDKKLEDFEKFFAKHAIEEQEWGMEKGYRCQFRRILKHIKLTRMYYSMWISEHYNMKWYEKHHEKWDKEKHKSFCDPLNSRATAWDEWGEPILFESINTMSEEEREEYSAGSNIAHEMDKKTYKLFIKHLSTLQSWWHVWIFILGVSFFYDIIFGTVLHIL